LEFFYTDFRWYSPRANLREILFDGRIDYFSWHALVMYLYWNMTRIDYSQTKFFIL